MSLVLMAYLLNKLWTLTTARFDGDVVAHFDEDSATHRVVKDQSVSVFSVNATR